MSRVVVIDASVGVKWFRDESNSDVARDLVARSASGSIEIFAPENVGTEILAAVRREYVGSRICDAWRYLNDVPVHLRPLDDELVDAAAALVDSLGCSFYDALAPALAQLLKAQFVSADWSLSASVTPNSASRRTAVSVSRPRMGKMTSCR